MQGNVDETHQLRDVHLSTIPGVAVVTYGRHTNTVFVTHVTGDLKFRCQDQSGMSKLQSLWRRVTLETSAFKLATGANLRYELSC